MEIDRDLVDSLRRSREMLGELYPILVDEVGEVIASRHRGVVKMLRKALDKRLGKTGEGSKS